MINNIVIIIKKIIGGKYATFLGDFALVSSENLIFFQNRLLTLSPSNGCSSVVFENLLIPTHGSHISLLAI